MSNIKREPDFDVKIVVAGRTNTGKSTFANMIFKMFMEQGIEVIYNKEFPDDDKFIKERLEALRGKNTKVEIVEMNYQPKYKRRK